MLYPEKVIDFTADFRINTNSRLNLDGNDIIDQSWLMMFEPDFQTNPPNILIVEDEKTLRLLARQALRGEGYQLQEASNGEECLEICSRRVPDLILLDAMMPGIDGFTCCRMLHQRLKNFCPPILMVTALDDEDSVELAFEMGVTEYITKPINWAVLRKRVYRLLKTRWALNELQQRYHKAHELMQQLEMANQKLERLAAMDGLTQVANRRTFDERLQEEWNRARREGLPLSLILCDVDYFKKYNDYYGHQKGDYCLQKIAEVLQDSCQRAGDLVARYGGEEFGIILAGIDSENACYVAQNIRYQLEAKGISHLANPDSKIVTLSLGIATMIPQENAEPTDLLAQADRALYEAKKQGRDRAVHFE